MDEAVLLELAELEERLLQIAARKQVRQAKWDGKPFYRCSCGDESTEIRVMKSHEWQGHVYQQFNQVTWSGKEL